MNAISKISDTDRYARCVQTSKRVRWDIDEDIIRGRRFDAAHKFLPDGLSLADAFITLSADEKRFVSQIQGRTYANVFGLVERFINAKVLELSEDHWFGDQVALEALVRFSDEELKHQALFRRVDAMAATFRLTAIASTSTPTPSPGSVSRAPGHTHNRSFWPLASACCERWIRSVETLPCRLARDSQRRPDLGPTYFPGSQDFDDLLELIALTLEGILNRLKALQ
jgi:hypothetical protein